MKLKRKQWVRIYQHLITNIDNNLDKFKVKTEDNGNTIVLEFYDPQYETMFTLRYL
jgi:hypothetical protein